MIGWALSALLLLRGERLRGVDGEEHAATLQMLSETRPDLLQGRTRALYHPHCFLADLLPGVASDKPSAEGARRCPGCVS